ncbi:hypothetical protein BKA69DRAFT_891079 [Paraphysoderma sedebokerense]|nr:hypothetical protein BKA69DRAFT_891079 [Paraphysoderma sedebokerense]
MSLPNKGQLYYTQNMSSNAQDWFPINEVPTTLPVNTGIVFVPLPDENGVPYTKFTFAATDMVLNSTINATVTINVAPVNDPPVFNLSSVANITAKEDTEQVLVFDIGDVDMDNRLSVKITNLLINGTLFNFDRQTGLRSSAAVGEGSELTGPPYQLLYVPTPNYFSPNSSIDQRFNVVITDIAVGGISFTHEIKFAVLPQNDAPELNCNPQNFVLPPDVLSGAVDYFNFNLVATDVDDSTLEYVLREAPAMGELLNSSGRAINGNGVFVSGNLTYRFNNSGGSYPFPNMTVYVVDGHGASSKPCTYEFTIDCPPGKYNNIFKNGSGSICDSCPFGAICRYVKLD